MFWYLGMFVYFVVMATIRIGTFKKKKQCFMSEKQLSFSIWTIPTQSEPRQCDPGLKLYGLSGYFWRINMDRSGLVANTNILMYSYKLAMRDSHNVKVSNGTPRHDHVVEWLLERTHRQIHGPNGKERERMNFDHERHERKIEDDPEEAQYEVTVEHEDALVLPRVLVLQVDCVQQILYWRAQNVNEQYGIL